MAVGPRDEGTVLLTDTQRFSVNVGRTLASKYPISSSVSVFKMSRVALKDRGISTKVGVHSYFVLRRCRPLRPSNRNIVYVVRPWQYGHMSLSLKHLRYQ